MGSWDFFFIHFALLIMRGNGHRWVSSVVCNGSKQTLGEKLGNLELVNAGSI